MYTDTRHLQLGRGADAKNPVDYEVVIPETLEELRAQCPHLDESAVVKKAFEQLLVGFAAVMRPKLEKGPVTPAEAGAELTRFLAGIRPGGRSTAENPVEAMLRLHDLMTEQGMGTEMAQGIVCAQYANNLLAVRLFKEQLAARSIKDTTPIEG